MEKKLKRVEFFYDDGTSKFIEDKELDKWAGMNRQLAIFAQMHKMNPDWSSVKWTEVEVKEAQPTFVEEMISQNTKSALD